MGVNKGDGPRTERVLLTASWARGEPERGRYDDVELSTWRKTCIQVRREGRAAWVVVHAGALPDWQIAREGWLDPDVLANWGCWVDRLGRALLEAVDGWIATWDPLGEASWYDGEARRAGRVLLDAQATAHVQLGRGAGATRTPVGAALPLDPPGAADNGLGTAMRFRTHRWASGAWVRSARSGRLEAPWALTGELANGTSALDVLACIGPGDPSWLAGGTPCFAADLPTPLGGRG